MKKVLIVIWLVFVFCKNPSDDDVDYVTFLVTTQEDIYSILITSGSDTLLNMGDLPISVTELEGTSMSAHFHVSPLNTTDWANEHPQCDCEEYLDSNWIWCLYCTEGCIVNGNDWEIAK